MKPAYSEADRSQQGEDDLVEEEPMVLWPRDPLLQRGER